MLTVDDDKAVRAASRTAHQPTERVAKLLQICGAIEQFEAAKASK